MHPISRSWRDSSGVDISAQMSENRSIDLNLPNSLRELHLGDCHHLVHQCFPIHRRKMGTLLGYPLMNSFSEKRMLRNEGVNVGIRPTRLHRRDDQCTTGEMGFDEQLVG